MDTNENKLAEQKKCSIPKIWGVIAIFIGIAALVLVLLVSQKGEETIVSSSSLKKAVNISELSTAQFTYNGVVAVYKDEKKKKLKCNIRYNAKAKAGIDMTKIEFDIDEEAKTVKPILPEIQVTAIVDEKSLSFLPEEAKIGLREALTACEEDAQREAEASPRLKELAEENLQSIITALTYPLLNREEEPYQIIWN